MKTKVRNEFILEAHKNACSEWKLKIEKECPELFKTKLEVGKWYKNSDSLFCIKSYEDNTYTAYGFQNNEWINAGSFSEKYIKNDSLATEEEVKEALIKEAKKRGFKNGVKFYSALYPISDKVIGESEDKIDWKIRNNVLYMCCDNGAVFNNGNWAEIISNPIEEKIKDLQKQLDELKKQL